MWVGGNSFIYRLHLGEMVNCFFFERVRKGLFHLPLSVAQGNTSLFNVCHGHHHSFPPPGLPDFFPRTSVSFWHTALLKLVPLAALSLLIQDGAAKVRSNISDPSLDQDQHVPATFPLADDSADPCWHNHDRTWWSNSNNQSRPVAGHLQPAWFDSTMISLVCNPPIHSSLLTFQPWSPWCSLTVWGIFQHQCWIVAIAAFGWNSFSWVNPLPSFKAYLLSEGLLIYSFKLQTAN